MVLKDFVGGIIKLHGGDNPTGLLGYVLRDANATTNAGKMSCRVVISTSSPDRSDDVVVTKGIDLGDHSRNPMVLLNHDRNMPVGFAEDPMGKYTVRLVGDNRLEAETYFSKATQLGEQAFQLVERKVLRGASIGFLPIAGMVQKRERGTMYKAAKLVEYSHLVLPDNQDCLVQAVEKGLGGKPLVTQLRDMLTPYIETRPAAVVGGWEAKAFDESEHPRAADGKFGSGGGSETTSATSTAVVVHGQHAHHIRLAHASSQAATAALDAGDWDAFDRHEEDAKRHRAEAKKHVPMHPAMTAEAVYGPHDDIVAHLKKNPRSSLRDLHRLRPSEKYNVIDPMGHSVNAALKELSERGEVEVHDSGRGEPRFSIASKKSKELASLPPSLTTGHPLGSGLLSGRLLFGMRRKSMAPVQDDTLDTPVDDDLNAEFAPEDDAGDGMKPGALFHHGLHDLAMQMLAFIQDGEGTHDSPHAKKTGEKAGKHVNRALAAIQAGHSSYLTDHPDQPELPGGGELGEEGDDDEDDIDLDGDEDEGEEGEYDNADDDDSDTDSKPAKKGKKAEFLKSLDAARLERLGTLNGFWEALKVKAVVGDELTIKGAMGKLKAIVKDKAIPRPARLEAASIYKSLAGTLVTKAVAEPAADDSGWGDFDFSQLSGIVTTETVA